MSSVAKECLAVNPGLTFNAETEDYSLYRKTTDSK